MDILFEIETDEGKSEVECLDLAVFFESQESAQVEDANIKCSNVEIMCLLEVKRNNGLVSSNIKAMSKSTRCS